MASIKPYGNGWRAQVRTQGTRRSKTFRLKSEAQIWASKIETQLSRGENLVNSKRTLEDLLLLYRDTETPKKRSHKWEHNKLDDLIRSIGHVKLIDLDTIVMSQWRDDRLKNVKSSTVNREWNLLSAAFNTALREWKWLNSNPLSEIKRPPSPPPRSRLISESEINLIKLTTGYHDCPGTIASRVGAAFLFAIETAMRAGEILSISPLSADLDRRVVHLPLTKNGSSRDVPLSSTAIKILRKVDCDFDLTSKQLDSNFRKYRDRALIENLHFHDTRHQAITNLAKQVEVLDLARITGITDLKVLLVYYNESAESIASKLY